MEQQRSDCQKLFLGSYKPVKYLLPVEPSFGWNITLRSLVSLIFTIIIVSLSWVFSLFLGTNLPLILFYQSIQIQVLILPLFWSSYIAIVPFNHFTLFSLVSNITYIFSIFSIPVQLHLLSLRNLFINHLRSYIEKTSDNHTTSKSSFIKEFISSFHINSYNIIMKIQGYFVSLGNRLFINNI